jgi:hypothetical protein
MIASNLFFKTCNPRQPPTTPCGRLLKPLNASHNLHHRFGCPSVHGRAATSTRHTFAHHLAEIFQPNPSENLPEDDEAITQLLETPYQLEPQSLPFSALKSTPSSEVSVPKKSSGYDLITGRILQPLPPIGIQFLGLTNPYLYS